jgi:hypothetical protein
MRALRVVAISGLLAGILASCEGMVTGTEVSRVPLQAAEGGAYAPVKFKLGPEMNPVAFNLRADFSGNRAEFGKWNTYRATLSKDGSVIAAHSINVNHPGSHPDDSPPPPSQTIHTLFIVDVQSTGEYELTITPVAPVAITLENAQADARRNVLRLRQWIR